MPACSRCNCYKTSLTGNKEVGLERFSCARFQQAQSPYTGGLCLSDKPTYMLPQSVQFRPYASAKDQRLGVVVAGVDGGVAAPTSSGRIMATTSRASPSPTIRIVPRSSLANWCCVPIPG